MIDKFKGEHFFLSNFYPVQVELKGVVYPSSEHAYMSFKNESEEWKKYCQDPNVTCGQVKRASRSIPLVDHWDDIKFAVMRKVVAAKFRNPELRQKLLDTGKAELVEGNSWGDTYWGVCNGKGENNLGKLLMAIRAMLEPNKP